MTPVLLGPIEFRGPRRTHLAGLRVYLASLRAHAPAARVVVFNRSMGYAPIRAVLSYYDVEEVDVQAFDAAHGIPSGWSPHTRGLTYRAWLREHPVERVLCTDLTDVVWQRAPEVGEIFTVAEESQRIAESAYNQHYLAMSYPPSQWAAIRDRAVLCAGVIGGSGDAVLAYLDAYAADALARPDIRRDLGLDQAFLALYAHTGRGPVEILPYGNAAIAHIGSAPPETVQWQDGTVTCAGVVPTLVHQYNRHPAILAALEAQWR